MGLDQDAMLSRKATPASISTIPLTSAASDSAEVLLRRWSRHYLTNAPKGEMRGDGEKPASTWPVRGQWKHRG